MPVRETPCTGAPTPHSTPPPPLHWMFAQLKAHGDVRRKHLHTGFAMDRGFHPIGILSELIGFGIGVLFAHKPFLLVCTCGPWFQSILLSVCYIWKILLDKSLNKFAVCLLYKPSSNTAPQQTAYKFCHTQLMNESIQTHFF